MTAWLYRGALVALLAWLAVAVVTRNLLVCGLWVVAAILFFLWWVIGCERAARHNYQADSVRFFANLKRKGDL